MAILENILIVVLFLGAMTYVINLMYKSFKGKKSCSSACGGGCSMEKEFVPKP
jgi:FeoB-associated Cys-rich membrane protein